MNMQLRILALTLPAALLAGCGGAMPNRGLESVHQPVVERTNYVLDLATAGDMLAQGEQERLAGWLGSLRLAYGDRVAVDDPAGSSRASAEVGAIAARYGILLSGPAPITPGAVRPGSVRVVLTRTSASVPTCPDYTGYDAANFTGRTGSNFGCATNSNLAAMIANPEDLVRGQPGTGTSDPATATKAITTLRSATPTGSGGLKSESPGGNQ